MKLFKKKYKLNERGKFILMVMITCLLVGIATWVYLDRIERIKDGTFIIVKDSECDK